MKKYLMALLILVCSQAAFADEWCHKKLAENETHRQAIMNLNSSFNFRKMLLAVNEESLAYIRHHCKHLPAVRENYCRTELDKVDLKTLDIAQDESLTPEEKRLLLQLNHDDRLLIQMAMVDICRDFPDAMPQVTGPSEFEKLLGQGFELLGSR